MDENVTIDAYCAEFDDENPQIVKPETFVLIVRRDPTLHVQSVFDIHKILFITHPPPGPTKVVVPVHGWPQNSE